MMANVSEAQKLIAVICMSNHRSYSKEMTLQLIMLLNISSSDTETNPGPKKNTEISFLSLEFINRFAVHNFSKVSLLEAMAKTCEYNIMSVGNVSWFFV